MNPNKQDRVICSLKIVAIDVDDRVCVATGACAFERGSSGT